MIGAERDAYDRHARACDADDLWGQVKRTLHGRPVPEAQIDLIVDGVARMLELGPDDALLDLCCGNGALTTRWFDRCAGGCGVDVSPFLIDVAQQRFARGDARRFVVADVLQYVRRSPAERHYTRAVCYGSLQYLARDEAADLLSGLRTGQSGIARVVVGNLPDRDRADAFFTRARPAPALLDSPQSDIGVWYTRAEFAALAARCGWRCDTRVMPPSFYAAHYRFDAVLEPAGEPT